MGSNTKTSKIKKKIDELKEELTKNDEVFRRNTEETRIQIQRGLYGKGMSETAPMYDTLIEKMELDIENLNIKIESKFEVIHPVFKYQSDKRWPVLQLTFAENEKKALVEAINEAKEKVEEVKKEISTQNSRIKSRRLQILEMLKDYKVDIKKI